MAESTSSPPPVSTGSDPVEYQAIESWSIVAMVLGLLAPLALVAPVLWIMPILGLLAGGKALRNLRREPGRTGRPLVLAGLALSTFFIVLPLSRQFAARVILSGQPRPVADQFFEYLREGKPEKALMLQRAPDYRLPLEGPIWLYFQSDNEAKQSLRQFVAQPPVRMLLALGPEAEVRFVDAKTLGYSGDRAQVDCLYAVSFKGQDGKQKTYFIGLLMERKETFNPELNPWRVQEIAGGVNPWATQ